jgi:bacterioferritin-associated ferredoxin
MYVCLCHGIKEAEVRDAGSRGVVTEEELADMFDWYNPETCGRCLKSMPEITALALEGAINLNMEQGGICRP